MGWKTCSGLWEQFLCSTAKLGPSRIKAWRNPSAVGAHPRPAWSPSWKTTRGGQEGDGDPDGEDLAAPILPASLHEHRERARSRGSLPQPILLAKYFPFFSSFTREKQKAQELPASPSPSCPCGFMARETQLGVPRGPWGDGAAAGLPRFVAAGWHRRRFPPQRSLVLQKRLRGLGIPDRVRSCASCNREEKSKCFILGSDSVGLEGNSPPGPRIWVCSQSRLLHGAARIRSSCGAVAEIVPSGRLRKPRLLWKTWCEPARMQGSELQSCLQNVSSHAERSTAPECPK